MPSAMVMHKEKLVSILEKERNPEMLAKAMNSGKAARVGVNAFQRRLHAGQSHAQEEHMAKYERSVSGLFTVQKDIVRLVLLSEVPASHRQGFPKFFSNEHVAVAQENQLLYTIRDGRYLEPCNDKGWAALLAVLNLSEAVLVFGQPESHVRHAVELAERLLTALGRRSSQVIVNKNFILKNADEANI